MPEARVYTISDVVKEAKGVRTYRCNFNGQKFHFLPGQFLLCQRLPDGKRASVTLSSHPSDEEGFEFTLKRMGEFGRDFYELTEVDDEISVIGPSGPFFLDVEERKPQCFIGRDYCVSPARSLMLERNHLIKKTGRIPRGKVFVLHEVSTPEQAIFRPEFEHGQPGFFYHLTVDDESSPDIDDPLGRINARFIAKHVPNVKNTLFFVCGEGIDVKYFRKELEKLGVDPRNVKKERWS